MPSQRRSLFAASALFGALLCLEGIVWLMAKPEAGQATLLWAALVNQLLWALLALAGAAAAGGALRPQLGLRRVRLPWRRWLVLAVGFIALSNALHQLLVATQLRHTGTLAQIDAVVGAAQGPSFLLVLLALGIAPGFGEEILFRGFLQHWLATRLRPLLAVALSAAAFGAVHADPVQSPTTFVLGLYLGSVVVTTRSVVPAIVCHALNNTLGVVVNGMPGALLPAFLVHAVSGGNPLAIGVLFLLAAGALAATCRWRVSAALPPRASPECPTGSAAEDLQQEPRKADQ